VAIQKTRLGTNADGTPHFHYASDGHVVLTGPISGEVTTTDGTTYDVTEAAVEVHPDHAAEVAGLVGDRYAADGHPAHDETTPFVHDTNTQES